jgi:hypothetical protein
VALVVAGWAAWYFGIELPDRAGSGRGGGKLRAANARTIPDLNLDLVWIAPGDFLMGTPEQNLLVKWFYLAREKLTKQPNLGGRIRQRAAGDVGDVDAAVLAGADGGDAGAVSGGDGHETRASSRRRGGTRRWSKSVGTTRWRSARS